MQNNTASRVLSASYNCLNCIDNIDNSTSFKFALPDSAHPIIRFRALISPDGMNSIFCLTSRPILQNYLFFIFGCWLLPQKLSDCQKKIVRRVISCCPPPPPSTLVRLCLQFVAHKLSLTCGA